MNTISQINTDNIKLITSEEFSFNSSTLLTIQNIFRDEVKDTCTNSRNNPILVNDDNRLEAETQLQWTKCGRIILTSKDKQLHDTQWK